jgi:hypothetical protein
LAQRQRENRPCSGASHAESAPVDDRSGYGRAQSHMQNVGEVLPFHRAAQPTCRCALHDGSWCTPWTLNVARAPRSRRTASLPREAACLNARWAFLRAGALRRKRGASTPTTSSAASARDYAPSNRLRSSRKERFSSSTPPRVILATDAGRRVHEQERPRRSMREIARAQ